MLQGPDVLDSNTLLLAQEGILYIAGGSFRQRVKLFKFRESRHANVLYAFYMRVLHAPEYAELLRRDEGLLFLLCLYSVLTSCPQMSHQIHVFTERDYISFNPLVDPHRFIAIPLDLEPNEFPFEGILGIDVL